MFLENWLTSRTEYYGLWFLIFLAIYGGAVVIFGSIPANILLLIIGGLILKDIADEYRISRGEKSIAYADVEHNPSNIVILIFTFTGILSLSGSIAGIEKSILVPVLAGIDLLLDGSQDFRHEV